MPMPTPIHASIYSLLKFRVIITTTPATILIAILSTNTTDLNANVSTLIMVRVTSGNFSSSFSFFRLCFSSLVATLDFDCPYHSPSSISLSNEPSDLDVRPVFVDRNDHFLRFDAAFFVALLLPPKASKPSMKLSLNAFAVDSFFGPRDELGGGGSKFSRLVFLVFRPRTASATATASSVDTATSGRKGLPKCDR